MSIVPTLSVLATWAVLALGLAAIGILFLNRLGGPVEPSWQYVFCGIWAGFSLLTGGLMLWHFFLPVNGIALVVFACAAALALICERRWLAGVSRVPCGRGFVLIAGLFTVWTANHALGRGGYDDYEYEFQAIRWYHEYPIVPGLANVHGRLGFNNSHHLFAAMLSIGPLRGAVNHVFNGFFVTLVCVFILNEIRDLAKGTQGSSKRSLFAAVLFCPCASLVLFGPFGSMISTLKADVFVCVATVSLTILFLRWAAAPAELAASRVLAATMLLIGCVIPSVKLSGAVFSLSIVAVVIVRSIRRSPTKPRYHPVIAASLAAGAVMLVLVPARGIILSGYPFFPSTALGFNVDWRVPVTLADLERTIVTSFARLPITPEAEPERTRWERQSRGERGALVGGRTTFDPQTLLGTPWLWNWALSLPISDRMTILLPFILLAASIPLLFVGRRQEPGNSEEDPPAWAYATIAAASIAALIFWFIEAPAARFAMADVWILFASILGLVLYRPGAQWNRIASLAVLTFILAAIAVFVFDNPHIEVDERLRVLEREERLRVLPMLAFAGCWQLAFVCMRTAKPRFLAALCLLPALFQHGERLVYGGRTGVRPMLWINYVPDRPPATLVRRTCSGLGVYQTVHPAFETPLPNTQYFDSRLQLRTARLEDGFVIRDCSTPK
jgi:hypothetical protein